MHFGRYEIKGELGKGSMGIVYQAYDPRLDRLVAIKVLKADLFANEAFVQRFLKEARAVARLTHPNIVSIYDADEDQGTIYIAMELLEGESLDQLILKRKVSENEIVNLGVQIAQALDYAHQKGIIHRDIKPGNIILDHNGRLKITDFGIARIEDPTATQQTMAGEILGTPAYMSPEQTLGQQVNGCTDIYSLGVVLYQLSTGALPFEGGTLSAMLMAIIHDNPPEPKTINAAISTNLASIIMRCLSKTADMRFQTGKALAEALEKCVQPEESVAPAVQPETKSLRPIGTFVLVLLLVLGIGGGIFYQLPIKKSNPEVVRPGEDSSALLLEKTKPVPGAGPETAPDSDEAKDKIESSAKGIAEHKQDEADRRAESRKAPKKVSEEKPDVTSVARDEKVEEIKPPEQTSEKETLENKAQESGLTKKSKPAVDRSAAETSAPMQEQTKPASIGKPSAASDLEEAKRKIEELEKKITETRRKQDEADKKTRELQEIQKKLTEAKRETVSGAQTKKGEEAKPQGQTPAKVALEKKEKVPKQEAIRVPQDIVKAEAEFPPPGTRYVYRITIKGGAFLRRERTFNDTFTVIEDAMFGKLNVHRIQMKERDIMELYDSESGNWIAQIKDGKTDSLAEPHQDMYRFPLYVGQKHQAEYSLTKHGKTGSMVQQVEVMSFEKVTVPAGTFEAFKIQVENSRLKRTCWYSPGLKIVVKREEESRSEGSFTVELIEYKAP